MLRELIAYLAIGAVIAWRWRWFMMRYPSSFPKSQLWRRMIVTVTAVGWPVVMSVAIPWIVWNLYTFED
jgi:hypothetical protein